MSKVTETSDLTKVTDPAEFMRYCSQTINSMISVINGGLTFDENVGSQTVEVSFKTANAQQSISHSLGRNGLKYFVVKKNLSCDVYDGDTGATTDKIFLKCTQIADVTIVLF